MAAVSIRMSTEVMLRVIIADDDAFARRVIKGALQAAGMTVVAEAKDGHEAVELSLHYRPDIVVMDVVMPGLDGILATRRILKANPDQLVVALTGGDEDELGLLALRAGAVGFLAKDADIGALARALEGVRRGEAAVSREMTRRLIERFRGAAERLVGPATDQEPPHRARMAGHRSPHARPIPRQRRRNARRLPRDGALPHQEHHAKARRPHTRRRRRRRRAPPARQPLTQPALLRAHDERDAREVNGGRVVREELGECPGGQARRSNRLRMRRCAKREGDRQLVGAHGLRAVPVIPPAEVVA